MNSCDMANTGAESRHQMLSVQTHHQEKGSKRLLQLRLDWWDFKYNNMKYVLIGTFLVLMVTLFQYVKLSKQKDDLKSQCDITIKAS